MSRKTVILGTALITMSGAVVRGNTTTIVEDNFDSYSVGPLDGWGNWTASAGAHIDTLQGGIAPPHTPPYLVHMNQADAVWEIAMSDVILGLTLEFYAEFQTNSDPHIYLSPDGVAWTEVTDEFDPYTFCDGDAMALFSADLSAYLQAAGVQETVFLRWANEYPILPNCYVIGFDSVTVTVTTGDCACGGYQGVECDPDYCTNLLYPLGEADCASLTLARGDHVGFADWGIPVAASPESTVDASATWCYVDDGGLNPNAVTYVTVFGDWQPDSPLAVLVDGELMGQPRTETRSFSFTAPETPGIYRIRWNLVEAFAPVDSFCSHPDGGVHDPGCGRYAEIPLVVCGPNADMDGDGDVDLQDFGVFAESFNAGGPE